MIQSRFIFKTVLCEDLFTPEVMNPFINTDKKTRNGTTVGYCLLKLKEVYFLKYR